MNNFLLKAVLILFPFSLLAQNSYDILAFVKYKQVAIDHIPNGSNIGFFDEAFGDASQAITEYLTKKTTPLIRVNLIWSDTHTFGDSDIPKIKRRSKFYQQLSIKFPQTKIEVAPFTEHNLQNPDKYLDIIKANCPNCIPVNSVWRGKHSNKYKNEVHGTKAPVIKPPCNFSFDGSSANDADVEMLKNKFKHCENFFLWTARYNGKKNDNDTTPRPNRVDWPKKEHIDAMTWLMTEKGNTSLPKNWINKPMADYHGQGDFKGDKLLLISPIKTNEILLKNNAGETIHKLKYFGLYENTLHRYYGYEWSYKIAKKCNGVCEVWANNKKFGAVNPGFRENSYR